MTHADRGPQPRRQAPELHPVCRRHRLILSADQLCAACRAEGLRGVPQEALLVADPRGAREWGTDSAIHIYRKPR